MRKDNYDPAMRPVLTVYNGEVYDSGLEARFAGTCDFLGIKAEHNRYAWMSPDCPTAQYKPDFAWRASTDEFVVAEVKGHMDQRSLAQRDMMMKYVDDPSDKTIALINATKYELNIYQDGCDMPAAFYRCPACGKGYIAAKEHPECPKCGEEHPTEVCVDFNTYYNETAKARQAKAMSDFVALYTAREAARAATAKMTRKLTSRIEELAEQEDMPLARRKVGILSPYGTGAGGQVWPDYTYHEPRVNHSYFGTAYMPLVLVYVSADPSKLDELHYEEMRGYVDDMYSPIQKLVKISRAGIEVYDHRTPGSTYQPGGLFTCDSCGATYFARDDAHECPCCTHAKGYDGHNNHRVSK